MATKTTLALTILLALLVAVVSTNCTSKRIGADDEPAAMQQKIWTPRWVNVGGDAQGDPAIASWGANRYDVFWRGTDNTLKHRWYDNGNWSGLEALGGDVRSSPAAVSTEYPHYDVFYFNSNRDLVRHFFPDANWQWATETIPIPAAEKPTNGSGPAVTKWNNGRLDVFWRNQTGSLRHIWRWNYDSAWTAVETFAETMSNDPAAVSWSDGNIDVLFSTTNGTLRHLFFPGCTGCDYWLAENLTGSGEVAIGPPGTGPGVASWGPGRLDVFWKRSTSGTLGHTWRWDGDGAHNVNWVGGIEDLGGSPNTGVDAVSFGSGRIDIATGQQCSTFGCAGNDTWLLTWQTASQNNPWYNDPPPLPTLAISEHVVASPNPWEFSVAVAAPFTNGCSGGGYAVSGTLPGPSGSAKLLRRVPLSAGSPADKSVQLSAFTDVLLENDSMMTRAPNGDLILVRGAAFDNSCGSGEEGTCVQQSCVGHPAERRSGSIVYRSSDCGTTWRKDASDKIDPLDSAYGGGQFGGGPCWGGWDREEIYFDYFSNRLFLTMGAETDSTPEVRSTMMFRSQLGGLGPYSMHQYKVGDVHQPIMMTSLPDMMFFATCEDSRPTLRWIEPENSHWNDAWQSGFPSGSAGMRFAQLPGSCGLPPDWDNDGSMSVSRVGTYIDDAGTRWWVVRVAVSDPPNARIITVRVNSTAMDPVPLFTKTLTPSSPPSSQQNTGRIVQLTMVEPDPSQTLLLSGAWSGENTTLYYWREEYWFENPPDGLLPAPNPRYNQASIIRALAVRDVSGYGPVFDVSGTWGSAVVGGTQQWAKPGDFTRGGFWYDRTSSSSDRPLRYLVTWGDIPNTANAALRAKAFAFARGFGND